MPLGISNYQGEFVFVQMDMRSMELSVELVVLSWWDVLVAALRRPAQPARQQITLFSLLELVAALQALL
jgi:hypothetical protein